MQDIRRIHRQRCFQICYLDARSSMLKRPCIEENKVIYIMYILELNS